MNGAFEEDKHQSSKEQIYRELFMSNTTKLPFEHLIRKLGLLDISLALPQK